MANSRSVYQRPDRTWANKRDDASRAGSTHSTQREAEASARRMLVNDGDGELTVHGVNGRIRSKTRDKEH